MKRNPRLEERRKLISKDIDVFVQKSFDIADRINELLQQRGIGQKELAGLLGKKESEVSKWLSGTHNFTVKTLSLIESVLKNDILIVAHKENTVVSPDIIFIRLPYVAIKAVNKKNFVSTSGEIYVTESGFLPKINAFA